jgi:hypothetical protein
VGDLEEQIQIPDIRSTMRIWQRSDGLTAFAYVDIGNNLRFEIAPGHRTQQLEQEILDWGLNCIRRRNTKPGKERALDASCHANDSETLDFLNKFGFKQESVRTLEYFRSLDIPIENFPFPAGFSLR